MSRKLITLRNNNVLIKIKRPESFKEQKGLVIKSNQKKAYYEAEIVAVSPNAAPDLAAGQKCVVYAQALMHEYDAPLEFMTDTKEMDYFQVFDSQIDAIIE